MQRLCARIFIGCILWSSNWCAGFLPLNFQVMPELRWRYGYLLWWVIALTGTVSLFTLFRRKRWL